MGIFSWFNKDKTSDSALSGWKTLQPDPGKLVDSFKAEVKQAREREEIPFLLFSSSFDDGSAAIRKFRKKMSDAYAGICIIEVMIDDWTNEEMEQLGFFGKFPYFAKIGADNELTGDIMTGDVWGEDTFQNMRDPIMVFLQGHS